MPRVPRRDEINADTILRVLRTGHGLKARVLIIDTGGGPVVVKDYASKRWWGRLAGRIQISRESRAYTWLGVQPGLPVFCGRIDAHALAIECLEGVELDHVPDKIAHADMLMAQLEDVVQRLHACGVAHLDLRSRKNMIVDEDLRLHIVDFGSAQSLRPGSIAHRVAFFVFRGIDEMAILKYRHMLQLEFSQTDRKRWRRQLRLRALWPFNRKRKGRNMDRWQIDGTSARRAPRSTTAEKGPNQAAGVPEGR